MVIIPETHDGAGVFRSGGQRTAVAATPVTRDQLQATATPCAGLSWNGARRSSRRRSVATVPPSHLRRAASGIETCRPSAWARSVHRCTSTATPAEAFYVLEGEYIIFVEGHAGGLRSTLRPSALIGVAVRRIGASLSRHVVQESAHEF